MKSQEARMLSMLEDEDGLLSVDWDPTKPSWGEEFTGEVPDPYRAMDAIGPEFTEITMYHLKNVLEAMDVPDNTSDSMEFQMVCDECKWKPCNITDGFEGRPCHMDENNNELGGFYLGEFPRLRD